jgi:hypothetical protein
MGPQDRKPFAQGMLVLAEAIQTTLSDASLEQYWTILQRYAWPLVESGLQQAMCRRWVAFPKPNELAELIEAALVQMAERRWLQLQEAAREVGPHYSIRCDDPALAETIRILWRGWPDACQRLRAAEGAERAMLRKDFLQAYRLAWERAPTRAQGYLKGLREIWQERGLNEELLPVMQLSDVDRPQPLATVGGAPVTAHPPVAEEASAAPLPADQVKGLLEALVKQLSMPGSSPQPYRRSLPPPSSEEETVERVEAARQRRIALYQKAREAGLLG